MFWFFVIGINFVFLKFMIIFILKMFDNNFVVWLICLFLIKLFNVEMLMYNLVFCLMCLILVKIFGIFVFVCVNFVV